MKDFQFLSEHIVSFANSEKLTEHNVQNEDSLQSELDGKN
jgi:hypothetical protein